MIGIRGTIVVECIVALGGGTRTLVNCNIDNSVEVALWRGVVGRTLLQIVNGNLNGAIETKSFGALYNPSYRKSNITTLFS